MRRKECENQAWKNANLETRALIVHQSNPLRPRVYQVQRALSHHAMLGQRPAVIRELLALEKQLLSLHRDMLGLAACICIITDLDADLIDSVYVELHTNCGQGRSIRRCDRYRHTGIGGLPQ